MLLGSEQRERLLTCEELHLPSLERKAISGKQPHPSPSESKAPRNGGPRNRSINSLTPSALHYVMLWNTDNKNHKTTIPCLVLSQIALSRKTSAKIAVTPLEKFLKNKEVNKQTVTNIFLRKEYQIKDSKRRTENKHITKTLFQP